MKFRLKNRLFLILFWLVCQVIVIANPLASPRASAEEWAGAAGWPGAAGAANGVGAASGAGSAGAAWSAVQSVSAQASGYLSYLPLVAAAPQVAGCDWPIPPQPAASEQVELDTLAAINAQRAAHGLPPVVRSLSLTRIARFHSRDLAQNHFFSHAGSAGETFFERMAWICDESYSGYGEIIGANSLGDIDWMIESWMNSPGHRAIILGAGYTHAGVGYAYDPDSPYGHYWTVDFGGR